MDELERLRARVEELEFHIKEINRELATCATHWPFHLPPKSALLLAVFVKHKNKVLTKEVLWRYLYGLMPEADQPAANVIDVFICKIRARLDKFGVHISTVYKTGYLIDNDNHAKLVALTLMPQGVTPAEFQAFLSKAA
jgi:DNA-binding response OmpR family regulator